VDADLLLSLAVKVASEHRTQDVLNAIVQGLADMPGVALARVWLLGPGDLCERCHLRAECQDRTQCLHLVASAGAPRESGKDWSSLDGHFRRIPLSYPKVAEAAAADGAIPMKELAEKNRWMARPEWLRSEGIVGFAGHSLTFRGKTPGALAVLTGEPLSEQDSERLKNFADHAAIAITNARSFEELGRAETALQQVMNLVQHHLAIVDGGFQTVFANKAARDYFGLLREMEPMEMKPIEFLRTVTHPDDVATFLEGVRRATFSGDFFEAEVRMRGRDAQYRWFLYQLYPVRDEAGAVFRWCVVRTDIEERKYAQERAERENLVLREEVDKLSMSEEIVGSSAALRAALARVAKVAGTDSTVLITGETGTGKELIARAIHKRSKRANRAFVSVNCAAIPKELIPSELFGHEKGAFTGALQRRLGRFELAEAGTIFLDEIGDLPGETQIALLRVLQEKEFQRVGSNQSLRADVRVITATHRDLQTAIDDETFRSDLFYRINVFPIHIPPLRERKEDIRLLVEYFIHRFASKAGKQIRHIEKRSMERLEAYRWPGNIRELQNVVERSIIVSEGDTFSVDESWLSDTHAVPPLSEILVSQEKEMIESALAASNGRISGPFGAALKLGIPRSTLESRIKALKIDRRPFQSA
jgi:PAS domain S-box-containing protein